MVNQKKKNILQNIGQKVYDTFFESEPLDIESDYAVYSGIDSHYGYDLISQFFTGDKFPDGFGATKEYFADYWTLRKRSVQLYTDNIYAKGLLNRLLTNEINTGLSLEAIPEGDVLNLDDDFLNDWSESTENKFRIWGSMKEICDWNQLNTFGQLQALVRLTSLLSGDCVIVLRQSTLTRLPIVEIIDGSNIQNPSDQNFIKKALARGNKIIHGVELDSNKRHIAYYILQANGSFKRVPVRGEKSKRLISFMVYGSRKRVDEIRGIPLLAAVLQSLKEIDRYKDSEQRAAVINSILPMFISKSKDKVGSRPMTGAGVRKKSTTKTNNDGTEKRITQAGYVPGIILDELQVGEEPKSFDTKRPNINFGNFEHAILSGIAWCNEIPPEILMLHFSNNYSASRAAINEFKIYLDRIRSDFSIDFCKPVYNEWLINMVLTDRIEAAGFLQAWRDKNLFLVYGAWIQSDWAGAIKPSVDRDKEAKAYERMTKHAWITNDRSAKELTGTKFSQNVRRIKKEAQQLAEAYQPLVDAGLIKPDSPSSTELANIDNLIELLTPIIEQISANKISEDLTIN